MIIVNNQSYVGRNLIINNNRIIIDGKDVTVEGKEINIQVNDPPTAKLMGEASTYHAQAIASRFDMLGLFLSPIFFIFFPAFTSRS